MHTYNFGFSAEITLTTKATSFAAARRWFERKCDIDSIPNNCITKVEDPSDDHLDYAEQMQGVQ